MDILYLNLYRVTRHFGGREEGGWWYDAGQPLASIPFEAEKIPQCHGCEASKNGEPCDCLEYPEDWDEQVAQYIEDGREWVYDLRYPDSGYWYKPEESEAIRALEANLPKAFQLVPKDVSDLEAWRTKLMYLYADEKQGNIGSVLGGTDLRLILENQPGEYYPSERPRYE